MSVACRLADSREKELSQAIVLSGKDNGDNSSLKENIAIKIVDIWRSKNSKGATEYPTLSEFKETAVEYLNSAETVQKHIKTSYTPEGSDTPKAFKGYKERAQYNIKNSDITFSFATDFFPLGKTAGDKFLPINIEVSGEAIIMSEKDKVLTPEKVAQLFLQKMKKLQKGNLSKYQTEEIVINITGNDISHFAGKTNIEDFNEKKAQDKLNTLLTNIVEEIIKLTETVEDEEGNKHEVTVFPKIKIISGGQTGADEAGIIAAQNNLIINWEINAPTSYGMTNKYNVSEYNNTGKFINRFIRGKNKKLKVADPMKNIGKEKYGVNTLGEYVSGIAQVYPKVGFVFPENEEAKRAVDDLKNGKKPDESIKINVNGASSVRTDPNGNLSENAYGIIVKTTQQNKTANKKGNREFSAVPKRIRRERTDEEKKQLDDYISNSLYPIESSTNEEFERFKKENTKVFDRIQEDIKAGKIKHATFPKTIALDSAGLPKEYADWLKKELQERFGISSNIEAHPIFPGYFGLRLGQDDRIKVTDGKEGNIAYKYMMLGAPKKGGITYKGKTFFNIDHIYQSWKTGEFNEKAFNNYAKYYELANSGNDKEAKEASNKLERMINNSKEEPNIEVMKEIITFMLDSNTIAERIILDNVKNRGLDALENGIYSEPGYLADNYWTDGGYLKALAEVLDERHGDIPKEITATNVFGGFASQSKSLTVMEEKTYGKSAVGALEKEDTKYDTMINEMGPKKIRYRANTIFVNISQQIDREYDKNIRELIRRRDDARSKEEKMRLQNIINNYTRINAITSSPNTLAKIIENVKTKFNIPYLEEHYGKDTARQFIDRFIFIDGKGEGLTEKEKEEKREYFKKEAALVVKYYEQLITQYVSPQLEFTEGVRVRLANESVMVSTDQGEKLDASDVHQKEETQKEGWMIKVRHESALNGLMPRVKQIIRETPRKIFDSKTGKYVAETDDFGEYVYLDASYVHASLLDATANMVESRDFMYQDKDKKMHYPALEAALPAKPWIQDIIDKFNEDPSIASLFYQGYRLDFLNLSVQRSKKDVNGDVTVSTVNVNKPEGTFYLLDRWRDNYESGIQLAGKDTLYNRYGSISKENANKGYDLIFDLFSIYNEYTGRNHIADIDNPNNGILLRVINAYDPSNPIDVISNGKELEGEKGKEKEAKDSKFIKDLTKALNMVGIDISPENVVKCLCRQVTKSNYLKHPLKSTLTELQTIFTNIKQGKVEFKVKNGTIKDLLNSFNTPYHNLADLLKDSVEDVREHNNRENGKSYYAHTVPSYVLKMIKVLKNVKPYKGDENGNLMSDEDYYQMVLEKEFGQYEWFKDQTTQEWMFGWVKDLAKNPELRKILDHKVVIHRDGVEYEDWESLDYTLVLMHEYHQDENNAWFPSPVLSDVSSAEFIRFKKIKDLPNFGLSVEDQIVDEMTGLALQELKRIDQCINRFKTEKKESLILYYDYFEGKNGTLIPGNGHKFNFIPELNGYKLKGGVESFIVNDDARNEYKKNVEAYAGKTLREVYSILLKEHASSEKIRSVISAYLYEVFEDKFDKAYLHWDEIGVFDEDSNPKQSNKHIANFKENVPFSIKYSKVKEAIAALEKAGISLSGWEGKNIIDKVKNNAAITRREAYKLAEYLESNNVLHKGEVLNCLLPGIFDKMKEYFYNNLYATANIIQLYTTDLAYYKNYDEFVKRIKEVHSPARRINTQAIWNGEKISDGIERSLYVADELYDRKDFREAFEKAADILIAEGRMTKATKNYILKNYDSINGTDAQAIRTIDSFRKLQIMAGEWNEAFEESFRRLMDPNEDYRMDDFSLILNIRKPFLYTQSEKIDHTNEIKQKLPTQHKNAEYVMIVMNKVVSNVLGTSKKMQAINDFMTVNNIDKLQFVSGVKVGIGGVINLQQFGSEDYDNVINYLYDKALINGEINPEIVHCLSFEDYGTQNQTPPHLEDTVQLIGTQLRKLISADISDDAIIEIDGIKLSKQEWLHHFNKINTANIVQSFMEISEEFADIEHLAEFLQEQVRSSYKYDPELAEALKLITITDDEGNKTKVFNIPIDDPVISGRVQTLLSSIIKKRVTKQQIKGGSAYQISSFGYHEDLKIVWETEDGEIWDPEKHGKDVPKRIKYYECYLPAWSKDIVELCIDESGKLDINKLPEELRRIIGYRVPTEDKYSMIPLYVKDFLPTQAGAVIMLPAEIVTQTGSDFDIDKLYLMFYEHTKQVKKYDLKRARYAFRHSEEYQKTTPGDIFSNKFIIDWIENNDLRKEQFSLERPEITLEKIRYNFDDEPPVFNSRGRQARNNGFIDLVWGVLTNTDTLESMIRPQGFKDLERSALINDILGNTTLKDLFKALESYVYITREEIEKINTIEDRENYLIDKFLKLSDSKLQAIYETLNISSNVDPLSIITQVEKQQQLMAGANLIGIYANHNANHALIQHLGAITVKAKDGKSRIVLNGEHRWKINGVKASIIKGTDAEIGEYISRRISQWLAASVDNAKNPILKALNQNMFTVNATALLTRLGYDFDTISLFLNQPIVLEITRKYFRERYNYSSTTELIKSVIAEYNKIIDDYADENHIASKSELHSDLNKKIDSEFLKPTLVKGILKKGSNDLVYLKQQIKIAEMFNEAIAVGEDLSEFVRTLRSDTDGGGAGPLISDTMNKIDTFNDFYKKAEEGQLLIQGDITPITKLDNNELAKGKDTPLELYNTLMSDELPYMSAFYNLGILSVPYLLKDHFYHFSPLVMAMREFVRKKSKYNRLNAEIQKALYEQWVAYRMTGTDTFNKIPFRDDKTGEITYLDSLEALEWYVKEFPEWFKKTMEESPTLAEVPFLQSLKVLAPGKTRKFSIVVFKNVGNLMDDERTRYIYDWENLLQLEDPRAQEMAFHLFMYSFFRSGLGYGPNGFGHFVPIKIRKKFTEYIEVLRDMPNENYDEETNMKLIEVFFDSFVRNNLQKQGIIGTFVARSNRDTDNLFSNGRGSVVNSLEVFLTSTDNPIVKDVAWEYDVENKKITKVAPYIYKRYNRKDYYYRLVDFKKGKKAVYVLENPLGLKNNFLEYKWNVTLTGEHGKDKESLTDKYEIDEEELESPDIVDAFTETDERAPEPDPIIATPINNNPANNSILNFPEAPNTDDSGTELCE